MAEYYYVGLNLDMNTTWHMDRLRNIGQGMVSVDTETVSLKDKTCIGVGIGLNKGEAYYFPVLPDRSPYLELAIGLTTDKSITKLYHNANYDIQVLRQLAGDEGFEWPDVDNIADSAILAQVQGNRAALDTLGPGVGFDELFTIPQLLAEAKDSLGKSKVNMLDVPTPRVAMKCMNDVRATWAIWEAMNQSADSYALDNYQVDIECLSNLKYIETKGFALDHEVLEVERERLRREVLAYTQTCDAMGFNPGSNQQVGYILASRGNILPFTKGKRRQLRTDEETLSEVDDPIASMVLAYRGVNKLLSTYVEPWRGLDRAYTHFRIDLSTGRLASFDRNLQNIPPYIRKVFNPDSSLFTWADISQLEMRVFAHMSQDPVMLEAYRSGQSIHKITQGGLWPTELTETTYARSKTFNFAMIYNANEHTLAKRTNIPQTLAARYRAGWLGLYSTAASWMQERMSEDVDVVEDIYHRRMLLPEVTMEQRWPGGPWVTNQGHVDKCKINYPVQGSGANIVKRGINWLCRNGYKEVYRLQVHDEHVLDGVVEWPKELDNLSEVYTPHEVKVGAKWI